MIASTIETITPEVAKEYLARNTTNRPLQMRRVEGLIRDMRAGRFVLTHQGIAFDAEGNLLDGQHRLTAVALSGVTVTMMVTRDVPREAVQAVDVGATRRYQDTVAFTGNTDSLRANTSIISMIRRLVQYGYNGRRTLTYAEINDMFNAFDGSIKAVYTASMARSKTITGMYSSVLAAALAAIMCGESAEAIRQFFIVYRYSDVKGSDYNNVIALRWARTMADKQAVKAMGYQKIYATTQQVIYQFIHGKAVQPKCGALKYDVAEQIAEVLHETSSMDRGEIAVP